MKTHSEKIPNPKEIEKEISEFLARKFGGNVKIVSPAVLPQEDPLDKDEKPPAGERKINFDLKPEDLVAYLDQFVVKQEQAKAILATKICTHFNRIKRDQAYAEAAGEMVGSIKSNVLMIGPTGVGKTYMIKLIAKKLGVPFVKGDATKFSETGYVGGDVEDLVRDLVREAEDDIELAHYGIIYIDEIDKIASSRNIIGADVSRTGVQRALLKPMEETDVDLKVPHDPISMIQEVERFRKTGKRDRRSINTRSILFIMSGAFTELSPIVRKRIVDQGIGFGAQIARLRDDNKILKHVKAEDLVEFGFESEFVGRLPVKAVFENLTEDDLLDILKNPNNPVILGKRLDFDAYGIQIKFDERTLRRIAKAAYTEKTGARGLVSAIESALLPFEKRLPSTNLKIFPVTETVITHPAEALGELLSASSASQIANSFDALSLQEKQRVEDYVQANRDTLSEKYSLTLTPSRIEIIAKFYCGHIMDVGMVIRKIKSYYDAIKKIELYFYKNHDINFVLEDDAVDFTIEKFLDGSADFDSLYRKLSEDFEYGLKLVRSKTGKNRFFITQKALADPNTFIANLIKNQMNATSPALDLGSGAKEIDPNCNEF